MKIRDEWTKCKRTIGGWPCIRTKHSMSLPTEPVEYEYVLSGKHGDIWVYSSTHMRCTIKNNIVANRLIRMGGTSSRKYKRGEEALVTFPNTAVTTFIKALKVPKSKHWQIHYANKY